MHSIFYASISNLKDTLQIENSKIEAKEKR